MNKSTVFIMALFIAILSYSVYKFFDTHDYKEVTEYTPFKGEARENPLFAARLFLKQMGVPTENKNDLQSIGKQYPNSNSVIILDTNRTTLSQKRTEQLLAWVRGGGHLITPSSTDFNMMKYWINDEDEYSKENECADDDEQCLEVTSNQNNHSENTEADDRSASYDDDQDYESIDHLQQVLEITTGRSVYIEEVEDVETTEPDTHKQNESAGNSNEDSDDNGNNDDNDNEDSNKTNYTFSNDEEPDYDVVSFWQTKDVRVFPVSLSNSSKKLDLSINPHFYSIRSEETDESHILIDDEIFLLQRAFGRGMITLTADMSIIENQLLRETDNAEFLWYLVHGNHKEPSAVWLFHNDEMPNLWTLMWRHGWMVMLSLIALLLFWLYQSMHRFGPLIPQHTIARRRLMEHIEASGEYFWKRKNKQALIDSTRLALNQRIAQLHPAWDNTDELGKVDHLAEMLELPTEQVKHILFGNSINNNEDFTQLIIKLESIRRQL